MSWSTPGYETLELSTQLVIGEALRRGHAVEVLDARSNFIRIRGNEKTEHLMQATRTSADTYVSALVMENKKVTKLLLREAGIRVPAGSDYLSAEAAEADFGIWKSRDTVVKPNSTNFGIAVSILRAPFTEESYRAALKEAFRNDDTVLVEEYVPGREFRFLVIGGAVRAVLHRVPANVVGDGRSSVAALVGQKNKDPRRGSGYTSPMEKLRMGEEERAMIRGQGMDFDSVPAAGHTVFLRGNSNISTGGDGIDFTDSMRAGYKKIAVAAAAAVGARICGIDMMISDVDAAPDAGGYGIIECNFNPALHIHDFPFSGENRRVETRVLDLLGL
jgi:D-alanine-D-alanine ligase-like ATP-grasp enzyme